MDILMFQSKCELQFVCYIGPVYCVSSGHISNVVASLSLPLQHIHSRSALECAYRTHLIAGVGFYQHLLLYIQSHYQLELQDCIDWTHVTDPLIGKSCEFRHRWRTFIHVSRI